MNEQELIAERTWWSEAMVAQVHQLRRFLKDEFEKSAMESQRLQSSVAELQVSATRSQELQRSLADETHGSAVRPRARPDGQPEQQEQKQEGGAPVSLEQHLEQDRRERQAELALAFEHDRRLREESASGLRDVMVQQEVSLREISRDLADLRASFAESRDLVTDQSGPLVEYDSLIIPAQTGQTGPTAVTPQETAFITRHGTDELLPALRRWAVKICKSPWFILGTGIVILVHSFAIGVHAERVATNRSTDLGVPGQILFIALYLIELLIRGVSEGTSFFDPRCEHFTWNIFDVFLIVVSITDSILSLSGTDVPGTWMFLRLLRLLRLAQMLQSFQTVRGFKEMRILVSGIVNCVRPLFWSVLLMCGLNYMTAIFLIETISQLDLSDTDVISEKFSSVEVAMYELFKAISGGSDWGDISDPLWEESRILCLAFILYVILGVFLVFNLVTAVFLEAATQTGDLQEAIYDKKDWIREAKGLFRSLAEEVAKEPGRNFDRGVAQPVQRIDRKDFVNVLCHRKAVVFLEEHGVDVFLTGVEHLDQMFSIMDVSNSGTVDVDEFVSSLYQLKGTARALDVRLEQRKIVTMLKTLQDSVQQLQAGQQRQRSRLSATGSCAASSDGGGSM